MRWDMIGSAAAVAVLATGCMSVSGSPNSGAQRERAAGTVSTCS